MLVTQQAAVHLGNDYLENLQSTKNQSQRTMKQLFDVTRKFGQRTDRNSRNTPDQVARKILEKDDSVERPGNSVVNGESLCILRFGVVHGKNS